MVLGTVHISWKQQTLLSWDKKVVAAPRLATNGSSSSTISAPVNEEATKNPTSSAPTATD